jgi:MFS family permease
MSNPATDASGPAPTDASTPTPPPASVSPGYSRYALSLLLVIYILNFLDRQIVNILAEPIKNELGLADWQLGLMSGFAFAVFYCVLGIPIARFAETRSRPAIIGTSVAVWSAFTALCGTAQNFVMLCLFRVGVGIGEAGCTPPAHSLITDYTPREKRASALSFYSMGVPLGSLIGLALGGLIADKFGWRAAFLLAGLPGLILGALAFFTLRETRSRVKADVLKARAAQPSFKATIKLLSLKRTFWLIALGAALKSFISYGQAPFLASFFLRNHPEAVASLADNFNLQSIGFLGVALGLISGVFGALSSMIGGWVSDKVSVADVRRSMIAPALAVLVSVPIFILMLSVTNAVMALTLLVIPYLLNNLWYGPVYATTQGLVPPNMRATAAAVLLFIINLIGLGLGPLFVGIASDLFATAGGMGSAEGIRWALIVTCLFGLLSFACFWMARRTIAQEMVS